MRSRIMVALLVTGAASACAVGNDERTNDTGGPPPAAPEEGGATLPEGGSGRGDGSSGTTKDAGPADGDGIDYGPPGPIGPAVGTACTKPGEELRNTCGQCGVQVAICIDGKVGAYGPCRDEKLAATNCIPGTSTTSACGYCGTKIRACRNDCTWMETSCKGEVTGKDRCKPGTVEQRLADCQDGEKRTYSCEATCAWGSPTPCAPSAQR